MTAQKLLPVLDVLHGHVVRGVAGERSRYLPISSQWTPASDPLAIAEMFRNRFGFQSLYLADLDGLMLQTPQWDILRSLAEHGYRVSVDLGVQSVEFAQRAIDAGAERVIVSLESLPQWTLLEEIVTRFGSARVCFSLDLRDGQLRMLEGGELERTVRRDSSRTPDHNETAAVDLIGRAVAAGIEQAIVLDVARVGTYDGISTLPLCRALRRDFPSLDLITGGGVRSLADIREGFSAGVDGILVASALHDGRLAPADIAAWLDTVRD